MLAMPYGIVYYEFINSACHNNTRESYYGETRDCGIDAISGLFTDVGILPLYVASLLAPPPECIGLIPRRRADGL